MAEDVYIDRLVVELTADITQFRRALADAIGMTDQLGQKLNDVMGRHVSAGDIVTGGLTAALAGAAIQASRTQIAVAGALQAIGRSAREAHEQIASAQRAQALLSWHNPARLPPPPGAAGAISTVPVGPQLPGPAGAAAAAAAAAPAGPLATGSFGGAPISTYHVGGVYQPGNRIWRIRQAELRRAAEGTPPGSPQWRDYEEARAAAGLAPDPNIPRPATPGGPVVGQMPPQLGGPAAAPRLGGPAAAPQLQGPATPGALPPPPGVPTLPHPWMHPTGMTLGQAALNARGVAEGRINHPDPRVRADGDLPGELSDSYSARLARELETAANLPPGPPPRPGMEWDPSTRTWMWADLNQAAQERRLRRETRDRVRVAAVGGNGAGAADAAEASLNEAMDLGARMAASSQQVKKSTGILALLTGTLGGLGRALGTAATEVLRFGLNIVGLGALFDPIMAAVSALGITFKSAAAAALAASGPFLLIGAAVAGFLALFVAANWDRVREFMNWLHERVETVLGDRWQRIVAAAHNVLAQFGGAAGELWARIAAPLHALGAVVFPLLMGLAEIVIRALDAIGAAVEGTLNILADFFGLIGALIAGDWADAWMHARGMVASFVDAVYEIFAAFFPEILDGIGAWWDGMIETIRGKAEVVQAQVGALVAGVTGFFAGMPGAVGGFVSATLDGIQAQFGERLSAIVDFVNEKVAAVVGFFEWAWSEIVGNSSVPDTVDGIASEFGRLGDVMVKPADEATKAVVRSFAQMQDALAAKSAQARQQRDKDEDQRWADEVARRERERDEATGRAWDGWETDRTWSDLDLDDQQRWREEQARRQEAVVQGLIEWENDRIQAPGKRLNKQKDLKEPKSGGGGQSAEDPQAPTGPRLGAEISAEIGSTLRSAVGDALRGNAPSIREFVSEVVTSLGSAAIGRAQDDLMGLLDPLLSSFGDWLDRLFAKIALPAANDGGGLGGWFGRVLQSVGWHGGMNPGGALSFGGGRAGGLGAGPVFPGRIYDVGEFGREKFVPASAGYILNDNDLRGFGGGRGVVNHFHFPPGTDARSFQASRGQIESMMLRAAGRGRRNA